MEPLPVAPIDNITPRIARWAAKILYFKSNDEDCSRVRKHLEGGLGQLLALIPRLSGSIVPIADELRRGRLAIDGPYRTAEHLLTSQVLPELNYHDLEARNFPFQTSVDLNIWPEEIHKPEPSFQARINFITGGFILAIRSPHCVTDAAGLTLVVNAWAAFCAGDDGSKYCDASAMFGDERLRKGIPCSLRELRVVERKSAALPQKGDRSAFTYTKLTSSISHAIVSGIQWALRFISDVITSTPSLQDTKLYRQTERDESSRYEIFFFAESKLKKLKDEIMDLNTEFKTGRDSKAWISTNDALASLIWACVTETWKASGFPLGDKNPQPLYRMAMQGQMHTREHLSVLAFYVDGRPLFTDPPLKPYIGNIVLTSFVYDTFGSTNTKLYSIAAHAFAIRQDILKKQESDVLRLVGAFDSEEDLSSLRFGKGPFPESTLFINSRAKMSSYGVDWGPLVGNYAKRERISGWEREQQASIMPKLDGSRGIEDFERGYEVTVKLHPSLMEALMKHDVWSAFADWRSP